MSRPRTIASPWRKLPDGRLTASIGEHGRKITLFQKRSGGVFYRAVWVPAERRKDKRSLGTTDPTEAHRLGLVLQAKLLAGEAGLRSDRVSLGNVVRRFFTECQAFLDNAARTQREQRRQARNLLAFFGEERDVTRLTADDLGAYRAARRAGSITVDRVPLKPCRERAAEGDQALLGQVLRWATTKRLANGERWLRDNPLLGVRRQRETSPLRPVATRERFEATRVAMHQLADRAGSQRLRRAWCVAELALVLAEATGRRIGSIEKLRWEDLDWGAQTIRWRADFDKKRRETVVPYPDRLFEEIRRLRREIGTIGEWVLPHPRRPQESVGTQLMAHWLKQAEKVAGLPKLAGGLWHPYRRKWGTERKAMPLPDVAMAGGWKDVQTLLTCYQHPDRETLLRVTSEERQVHDVVSG